MNFAEIEHVWRSPHNRPTAAQLEQDRIKFTADLRRRHRGFVLFMTLVCTGLTIVTGRLAAHWLWARPHAEPVAISREWGALLMLALPWLAVFFFVRQFRRHRLRPAAGAPSISASVRALLDENRLARWRLACVAGLPGTLLLILPLVVYQLRAVGKAGDEILIPAFVIWPLIAVGILSGLRFHDRRTLLPRKRELEALLNSYE